MIMGKALTHKMEGKHHHISGEMLRKYGAPEEVALAAEQHHDDVEATSVEALIIRTCDAISASRPGLVTLAPRICGAHERPGKRGSRFPGYRKILRH